MRIAILAETDRTEARVAATPETVKKFLSLGANTTIQTGAGIKSGFTDAAYQAQGGQIVDSAAAALAHADVALCVRRPNASTLAGAKENLAVISMMDPFGNETAIGELAKINVSAFAMELMPRITRAQTMDVLSSQANLAGYRAVIEAAAEYGRSFPMTRRLGAIVTATDVRPATKEQVESLGAKFIAVENDEFKQAETSGGYAKEMSLDYQKAQADLIASHISKQDIVITTALIPGRPAPKLVTEEMVQSMRNGSVIVDLAAERGGNCALTQADEIITVNDVKIIGAANLTCRMASTASSLYAKNLFAFLETMISKETKTFSINWDDELVKATALTREGVVLDQRFIK
ncbi:MAG: NAD(P) transhydrogenase subunit alpha [Methylocystaceae bacterium]|nr:NAD(P) transhydrogenase subunit alpha [Methylocystaceae bacterium]